MDGFKEKILGDIKETEMFDDIELSDIPKLDLYMDQVITLFETELKGLKRVDEDKILTKTMINNYTKDKLLMPGKNKKYSRNHIIMMILIYNLKQILSINDIKTLLNRIVKNSEDSKANTENIERLYENFLHIKKIESSEFQMELSRKLDLILEDASSEYKDEENYEKLLLTVLVLINSANIQKRLAEKLIDKYFKYETF